MSSLYAGAVIGFCTKASLGWTRCIPAMNVPKSWGSCKKRNYSQGSKIRLRRVMLESHDRLRGVLYTKESRKGVIASKTLTIWSRTDQITEAQSINEHV